jgi:hypothetical protein
MMKYLLTFVKPLGFYVLLLLNIARAQDNHYAWMQYGSRNSLLYNAGLSQFEDQSAVILNPATLSSATGSSFNFNTNAVGLNYIRFENGLGQGFTLANSNLNILPSMASGVLKPKKNEKDWVLGYALYHSTMDNLNFTDRTEQKLDLINEAESPGAENYISQYQLTTDLDEVSVVAGLGWNISKSMALGLSQTFVYRSFQMIDKFTANAIPDVNSGASVDLVSTTYDIFVKYWKLYTYTKLGMTARVGKWDFGATLSTPALGIMGTGEMNADLRLINIGLDDDPSTPRRDFLANGRFEKIKPKYKLPWSLALGANRRWGNVRMYGALNFFSIVKKYAVLDPGTAPFIQPPSSENVLVTPNLLTLWDAKRFVFNGSLAADWIVREDYHLLFSFRNDNYYSDLKREDEGFIASKKTWNNYHVTFGTQRDFRSSQWVIGLRLNMGGRNDFPQPFSFNDPTEDNFFQGEPKTGKIRQTGLQLLLSYTFKIGGPK